MTQPLARILVVDDQLSLLELLERWLTRSGYEVRCAEDGFKALALSREHRFEIVITDLKMPGMSGLQLLTMLKELDPGVEVIFLSGQGTMKDAIEALREGRAFDFLQKPLSDYGALNTVVQKALLRRKQALAHDPAVRLAGVMSPLQETLTPRDMELLVLVDQGLDNRAIAERLSLSEKTVRNYLTRIYEKLGVSSRTKALAVCREHGLL